MNQDYMPELYDDADWDIVEQHICKYFGDSPNVFHEIVSPDIHVDIYIIPPNDEKDYYTLVTMGMGAHKMNVPEELSEYKLERAELIITLPADWKITEEAMKDEKWYWPIRLLKSAARLPGECDTWLGWGHTVDNCENYADNTKLCGSLLLGSMVGKEGSEICQLSNGEVVNFYQLIPLYREEMDFKCKNDAESLLDIMSDVSFVVDIHRDNVKSK